ASFSRCQAISGLPPASSRGLGVVSVSGRMRSPRPAAKMSAFTSWPRGVARRVRLGVGTCWSWTSGLRTTEEFRAQGKLQSPASTRRQMPDQAIPLQPVLLSGGSGTRLWPLSRERYPKQFLPLAGERTTLQDTWLRVAVLAGNAAPLAVPNDEHRFPASEPLRQVGVEDAAIVPEAVGRNTAPAIAATTLQAMAGGSDPLLLMLPSDHV